MGYNTRRKSLSLPSLGIQVPGAPRSARSPPANGDGQHQHIAKKQKRAHSGSNTSTPPSPPRSSTLRFDERPLSSAGRVADTPPPSPGGDGHSKIDTQGIDDTIVVGVIEQLEKTGNRPHLLKELAAVLSSTIPIVESSANPAAIISSRLATYLKRPWTALSPCPLDKTLVGTHPKRVYYFLATCPHQPIPAEAGNGPAPARIISPSLSSAASEEEDLDARSRDRMSPSPELDLSDYDQDHGSDPFSNHTHPPTTVNIAHNRRAQSPPLEREEREFTQTASFLQQQQRSRDAERERSASASVSAGAGTSMASRSTADSDVAMDDIAATVDETEESAAQKNSETAAALFGQMGHVSSFQTPFASSSPVLKPTVHLSIEMPPPVFKLGDAVKSIEDVEWSWSDMKSPESVELEELDDLLGEY